MDLVTCSAQLLAPSQCPPESLFLTHTAAALLPLWHQDSETICLRVIKKQLHSQSQAVSKLTVHLKIRRQENNQYVLQIRKSQVVGFLKPQS